MDPKLQHAIKNEEKTKTKFFVIINMIVYTQFHMEKIEHLVKQLNV